MEKFKTEMALYESFAALLRRAEELAAAFQDAGIQTPEPLKRLFDEDQKEDDSKAVQLPLIPPIRRENIPTDAGKDWISIWAQEGTPTSVTLALLRGSKEPVRPRDLNQRVLEILPDATAGSVANIGTRLGGSVIDRGEDGWSLARIDSAPVLFDGFLWGPPSVFQKQEIAAHRREALLYVLERFPSGLQIVQIADELKKLGWVKAPINKDLVKDDVNVLAKEQKIRRRGNSGKWEIGREGLG